MPKVILPQGPVHYREAGSGEHAIVFVHGYLMGGDLWDEVTERLSGEFRCLAPTWPMGAHREPMRPGTDLTPHGVAAIVDAFLAALDLTDVTLVGNDSGGAYSQVVATRHPERIGRLVLTSCDAFEEFPPRLFKPLVQTARMGGLKAALQPLKLRPARSLPIAYGWLTTAPLPHDRIDGWVDACFGDPGVLRDLRALTIGLDPKYTLEAAAALPAFGKPALVAWSADDKLFDVELGRRLAATLPDSRFELIEGARTWSMLDRPDRLAELIGRFVRETTPAQAGAAV